MSVKIDRYCRSIVQAFDKPRNKVKHVRKRAFCKKSKKASKRVKQLINYMYESSDKFKHKMYFVTITTMQHKTNLTDIQINLQLRKWLKNRKDFEYVNVLERQLNTSDLHYHLVVRTTKKFDIPKELKKLSKLLGTESHPALFDVKHLNNIAKVIGYINKYVTKATNDDLKPLSNKPQYSSFFYCRTFNASRGLTKDYKNNAHLSVVTITNDELETYKHLFVEKYVTEWFRTFIYTSDIWALASQLYKRRLEALLVPV